ncbi:CHY zinc finger family protein [Spironucleus salmonicida]|uniref:CHY zinc finger family protein n=1 Tax=Spironucleus salmonicida TaxID=348837 RepID=A0A9P8RXD1_9EUKA|nr:CHY zinc finger family protein [Spironucleus salmonicida]
MQELDQQKYQLNILQQDDIVDVIVAQIIRLAPGSLDRFDRKNYIIIKEFLHAPLNQETQQQQIQQIQHVYFHAPASKYDPNQPDMEFINSLKLSDEWYTNQPLDSIIFQAFRQDKAPGCQHRICGHKIICNVCNKIYGCRYCHDDIQDHQVKPCSSQIICRYCNQTQDFSQFCTNCSIQFGITTCFLCARTDWRTKDALPFVHCDQCETCYRGFEDDNIHCDVCQTCFTKAQYNIHLCSTQCSVCLQQFCESQLAYLIPPPMWSCDS